MSTCGCGRGQRDLWPGMLEAGLYLLLASLSHAHIVRWFRAGISKRHQTSKQSYNVRQRSDLSDHQNAHVVPGQSISFPPSASTQIQVVFMTKIFSTVFPCRKGVLPPWSWVNPRTWWAKFRWVASLWKIWVSSRFKFCLVLFLWISFSFM